MQPDGSYVREEGGEGSSSQEALYRYFSTRRVSLQADGPQTRQGTAQDAAHGLPRRSLRDRLKNLFHD